MPPFALSTNRENVTVTVRFCQRNSTVTVVFFADILRAMEDKLYDTVEAATFLGVSRESVNHYVRTEKLPSQKYGRARLIRESDLIEFMKQDRKPGRPKKADEAETIEATRASAPVNAKAKKTTNGAAAKSAKKRAAKQANH